jgi:hypothetical protein
LLSEDSAQNATSHKSSSLNLVGEGENQLSIYIVSLYRLADLPIVPAEILSGYTVEDGGHRGSLCSAVCCPNPVLIQPGHPAVPNEHYPIGKRLDSALDIHPGGTVAKVLGHAPVSG